jgi:hypothetical protein
MSDLHHWRPGHRLPLAAGGILCLALLALTGCGGGDLLDSGRWDGSVFVHEGLGLRVTVPGDWIIAPDESSGQLSSAGRELLSTGDPTGSAYGAEGQPTSRQLFAVYRYPLGTVKGINPSLVAALENVAARPQIQTAADYLQMLETFLSRGGTPMTFEPIVPSSELAGQEFAVLAVTLQPAPDLVIGQVYHARRVDDSVFTLVATFSTPQQWAELEAVLGTVVLER